MSVCESEHAEGGSHYLEHSGKSTLWGERSVLNWWRNLVSLEIDREKGEKLESCGFGKIVKACSEHPFKHEKKSIPFTCKDDLCPVCGDKRVAERVRSAWSRMERIGGKWWHITFTIPGEAKVQIKRMDSKLKLTARATRRAIEEVVGGRIGGLYVRHTFSSKAVWREFYHVHVLFSMKVITKSGGVKEWKWFEKDEIKRLKRLYVKYVIQEVGVDMVEETGVDMRGCGTKDGLPVVNVEYVSRGVMRRHTLPYALRNPVMFHKVGFDGEDVWLDVGGEDGQVIVDVDTFKGVFRHYFTGRHRAVWLGFLAYNCGERYYVLVGKGEFKTYRLSKSWDVCGECGSPMVVWEVIDCGYGVRIDEMGYPL